MRSATNKKRCELSMSRSRSECGWHKRTRPSPSFSRELARSYDNIANIHRIMSREDQAAFAQRRAMAIYERLSLENPAATEFQLELAKCHMHIAVLERTVHQDQTIATLRLALAILERLVAENPTVVDFHLELAKCYIFIGLTESENGHSEQAFAAYDKSLSHFETVAQSNPTVPEFQSDLAGCHETIAQLQQLKGSPLKALEPFGRALAIRERLARESPTVTKFQSELAVLHYKIGNVQIEIRHPEMALEAYDRAIVIGERLAREHPELPEFALDVGIAFRAVAGIHLAQKRYKEGRSKLEQAAVWHKRAMAANPKDPNHTANFQYCLEGLIQAAHGLNDSAAEAQRQLNELKASDTQFQAIDARLAAILRGDRPKDGPERLALAQHAYDTGRYTAATKLLGEALEIDPKLRDDRQAQHCYNAACDAALAGTGKGIDNPSPDASARAKLRKQARDWLEVELALWSKALEAAKPDQGGAIAQTLAHWQADTDLAGVRESEAVGALPEAERMGWQTLWTNDALALARAQARKP